MKKLEILGFGSTAVDDTYTVDGLPAPDSKKRYLASCRTGGGQTATALVAAARMGCSCRWGGWLGADDLSDFTRSVFEKEGVDYDRAVCYPGAGPVHSIILSDTVDGSRTLLWNGSRMVPREDAAEQVKMLSAGGCLFVDQLFPAVQVKAARAAVGVGLAVVGDIEYFDDADLRELAEMSDHLIVPLSMTAAVFGESDPVRAVMKVAGFGRKRVACVTDGVNGCWFVEVGSGEGVRFQGVFDVGGVVDTNGCGDVFHGVYAAGLVKGFSVGERVRRAACSAALKTRKAGGQEGAPRLFELENFLRESEQ